MSFNAILYSHIVENCPTQQYVVENCPTQQHVVENCPTQQNVVENCPMQQYVVENFPTQQYSMLQKIVQCNSLLQKIVHRYVVEKRPTLWCRKLFNTMLYIVKCRPTPYSTSTLLNVIQRHTLCTLQNVIQHHHVEHYTVYCLPAPYNVHCRMSSNAILYIVYSTQQNVLQHYTCTVYIVEWRPKTH